MTEIISVVIIFFLGYLVGVNTRYKPAPPTNEELQNELTIAQNLNYSLKKDKTELQEKLWKLTAKKETK